MCNWESFCTFTCFPQYHKPGIDPYVRVKGVAYEVEPDLAGETLILF
jgi:hypothetical protein